MALIFHGMVSDVYPHMYAMDIVLIPSLFESFGYVALEAFSVKKPVIASDTGGLKEILDNGNTGLLVPPGDVLAIKEAVKRILDKSFSARIAENGYLKFMRDFTEERMIKKIAGIYENL